MIAERIEVEKLRQDREEKMQAERVKADNWRQERELHFEK